MEVHMYVVVDPTINQPNIALKYLYMKKFIDRIVFLILFILPDDIPSVPTYASHA
jgi:hypothetical protein